MKQEEKAAADKVRKLKKKARGRPLEPKVLPKYPIQAEREYRRKLERADKSKKGTYKVSKKDLLWIALLTLHIVEREQNKALKSIIGEEVNLDSPMVSPVIEQWVNEQRINSGSPSSMARSQISRLSGTLTKVIQEELGIGSYRWVTKRDDRVRPSHRELNGRIFKWSDPPAMWYMRAGKKVYSGRRCHPGEEWGCRCVAAPVIFPSLIKAIVSRIKK